MGVKLPNGSTVHIAAELEAEKAVTVATNAAEAVLTATGHGLKEGDIVVIASGWGGTNGRAFKVSVQSADANTFKLKGFDTSDTERFPAGGGTGSFRKVKKWVQITQITEVSINGGEQQFATFGFLEDDFERQLPSTRSAASLEIKMADDPSLPGFKAAAKASDSAAEVPLRLVLKGGSEILYNGYPSLNKTPTLQRNEIMTVSLAYSLSGEPNRY